MRASATHRLRAPFLILASLLLVGAGSAHGQINPIWDHYLVYLAPPHAPGGIPVLLRDQFTTSQHVVDSLICFATPVEKNHAGVTYPIHDPRLHYAWWSITPYPFTGLVMATNQFGAQLLEVRDVRFLWNPALKNEPGQPPFANHYKCYDCVGDPINETVFLRDQFSQEPSGVLFPKFFCNPTEKVTPDGLVHPIRDPDQHYVCYDITPRTGVFPAYISDQFVQNWYVQLRRDNLLCVPSDKQIPTSTAPSTWGRLKVLYR